MPRIAIPENLGDGGAHLDGDLRKILVNVESRVAATQVDSVAADAATLKTDFNALLAKLKAAGLMA